jgi:hypothetical protein
MVLTGSPGAKPHSQAIVSPMGYLYAFTVGVLSDAIIAMRTGRSHSTRHELYAPWGMHFTSGEGAGFQIALRGSCWLIPPQPAPPVALRVGDVAFVRGESGHGLADSPSSPLAEVPLNQGNVPYIEVRGVGAGPATVVLCGAYMLDQTRTHPLWSEVPQVVHLPAQMGSNSSLRAAVELLGRELDRPLPGIGAIVQALLDTLLLYILRTWFAQTSDDKSATGWAAALNDPARSRP